MRLHATIYGTPQPQGSKTVYNGRAVDANAAKLKPWRKAITQQVGEQLGDWEQTKDAVTVRVDFYLPRPKTVTRKHHTVKPDVDKLLRAILDGVSDTKQIWLDDSQVTDVRGRKHYTVDDQPRAEVVIESNN